MTTATHLAALYREARNHMRNLDGLHPQEALEELLKYLLFRQSHESHGKSISVSRKLKPDGGYDVDGTKAIKQIRSHFTRYLRAFQGNAKDLWRDGGFHLSDAALLAVHQVFVDVNFATTSFDVRSTALRMFLSPDLRRGLGIYLTPDAVVRSMVMVAAPARGDTVYDPACGSGTFLIETLRYWCNSEPEARKLKVRGSDVSARMLLLAELNLGHIQGVTFVQHVRDALSKLDASAPRANSVDLILTNPPFGVYVEAGHGVDARRFTTMSKRGTRGRVQSEVLFIEQCLRWLRPGGLLAIVVPRSVLTNEALGDARKAIDTMAELQGVLALPPETFMSMGTQTNTSVLFLRKRQPGDAATGDIRVPVVEVSNVGYDSTGRERAGCELAQAAKDLRASMASGRAVGMARQQTVPGAASLSSFAQRPVLHAKPKSARYLKDVVELAQTGKTPARAAYTAEGVFTLKVGNLTGQGIDWTPRERNFVAPKSASENLLLKDGDIVLTSSAHNPRYIAQKVDIVHAIPAFVGGRAVFVGEVLRLRVKPDAIDPFELLALLRLPATKVAIQQMIRGQTAHLRPKELLELPLPKLAALLPLVKVLRREAELARELNLVGQKQRELFAQEISLKARLVS